MNCINCNFNIHDCICDEILDFMEENQELMEDLTELEASERPGAKRCHGCLFFTCQCKKGHANRLKKL